MAQLRENVRVKTATGELAGYLFVGAEGLPELRIDEGKEQNYKYRPATLPTAWRLSSPTCGELYQAWLDVERIQRQLAVAQREAAEKEIPQPDDDITAFKRQRALEEE